MTALSNQVTNSLNEKTEEKLSSKTKHSKQASIDRDSAFKAGLELLNAVVSALEAKAWQGG